MLDRTVRGGADVSGPMGLDNPIDCEWLRSWIQPQHIEAGALEGYRQGFRCHPARLIWIPNFLQPDIADRLSRFLAGRPEFQPEYGLYLDRGSCHGGTLDVSADAGSILPPPEAQGNGPRIQNEPQFAHVRAVPSGVPAACVQSVF